MPNFDETESSRFFTLDTKFLTMNANSLEHPADGLLISGQGSNEDIIKSIT